jgi:polyhydroxyalkanoate synthesis regulator phasin
MPAWKETLDEQARWDVINYIRALGEGKVPPASQMGGAMFDPEAQATRQAEMLAQAVTQGVVTQEEADTFVTVHDAMEQYRTEHPPAAGDGLTDTEREAAMLAALVEAGTITQEQADTFGDIHDRLGEAGLMP